jgi:cytochrome c553
MLKKIITLLGLAIFIISCQNKNKTEITTKISPEIENSKTSDSISQLLVDQKCNVCHGFTGKTEAEMIGPPLYAVKRRYLKVSDKKEDFVLNMSNWIKNPQAENALMRSAFETKGLMPHLSYSDEDINEIVNYIYETEMPKPDWFDAHQQTEQQKKKGQGQGQGQGNGQGSGQGNGQGQGQGNGQGQGQGQGNGQGNGRGQGRSILNLTSQDSLQ